MTLYLDTSALVKLYVEEVGSSEVRTWVEDAAVVATSRISWAEVMSAFARRSREVPADATPLAEARRRFRADWPSFLVLDVSQDVVERAGRLAEAMALRGYDAVQLGSADALARAEGDPPVFACFDRRLNAAAMALGMTTPFGDD